MQKHYLEDLITPVVEGQGYELVRVLTMGGETHPTLQVMIDTLNGKSITVDDCAKVSRALSEVLDEKDPIKEKYSLEVSSPGLDRPLTKLAHFENYIGYLWAWILNIILIVFFCKLKKDHIKHLLKEE